MPNPPKYANIFLSQPTKEKTELPTHLTMKKNSKQSQVENKQKQRGKTNRLHFFKMSITVQNILSVIKMVVRFILEKIQKK